MKKYLKIIGVVFCVLALTIALVACNDKCTEHVDDNADGKCDVCGEVVENNNNNNGGNNIPACTHEDKNLDEKCDLCGVDQPLNDGKETYSVHVSNGIGGGHADMIVEFYSAGQRVLMTSTNLEGYAYVRLPLNMYDVVLTDTLSRNLYFEETSLKVTPTKKNLEVEASIVITSNVTRNLMECDFIASTEAPVVVGEGSYRMEATTSTINPIVWIADKAGIYKFTFESDFGVNLTYNGEPLLLYNRNIANEEDIIADNSLKMTVRNMNLAQGEGEATPYVFGVKSKITNGIGVLKVERIGDPPFSIYELPWNTYSSDIPGDLNLPEELTEADLNYLNLTQSQNIVYNENDGLYHLGSENGKIVYIQLKHTPTTMPAATADEPKDYFTLEALVANNHFGVYLFDEEGELLEKNSYHDHALACLDKAHETAGIYYLTSGMMKGVKEYGEVNKWWDFSGERHIFGDKAGVSVLEEYAWMFCLCTID